MLSSGNIRAVGNRRSCCFWSAQVLPQPSPHRRFDGHHVRRAANPAYLLTRGQAPDPVNDAGYYEEQEQQKLDGEAAGSMLSSRAFSPALRTDHRYGHRGNTVADSAERGKGRGLFGQVPHAEDRHGFAADLELLDQRRFERKLTRAYQPPCFTRTHDRSALRRNAKHLRFGFGQFNASFAAILPWSSQAQ